MSFLFLRWILDTVREIFAILFVNYIFCEPYHYTDNDTEAACLLITRQILQQHNLNSLTQGLHAEHGAVTEDDILMELTKWVESTDNDILSDIYQQTINYVVSGQNASL